MKGFVQTTADIVGRLLNLGVATSTAFVDTMDDALARIAAARRTTIEARR